MAIRVPDTSPDLNDMHGRSVVITGASRGLGHALSVAFSNAGAHVALVARSLPDLEKVAAGLPNESLMLSGDVTDRAFNAEVCARVVEQWGSLDVWIANAGISPIIQSVAETDSADWESIINVNLHGVFYGLQAAADAMTAGSSIIVTGSVLGQLPRAGLAAYSASKAAVASLVRCLALELGERDITVNVVAPGWFDSPLTEKWVSDAKLSEAITGHTALRRWGRPEEDLAGAYLFLASGAARYITGHVLNLDGGYVLV
jgi:NAD(P)-dependent dehydrogenase (short-subunit alcohol dehydrogenase family)